MLKFCFVKHFFSPLITCRGKGKDPGGPKTCGSCGSVSPKLLTSQVSDRYVYGLSEHCLFYIVKWVYTSLLSLIRGYPICYPRLESLLPGDPFPSRPVCKKSICQKTKQCGFSFACWYNTVFTQSLNSIQWIHYRSFLEENFALKKLLYRYLLFHEDNTLNSFSFENLHLKSSWQA